MTKAYYSQSTGGIYPVAAYKTYPEDAIEIPTALYNKFKDAKVSSFSVENGKVIENVQSTAE